MGEYFFLKIYDNGTERRRSLLVEVLHQVLLCLFYQLTDLSYLIFNGGEVLVRFPQGLDALEHLHNMETFQIFKLIDCVLPGKVSFYRWEKLRI